MLLGRSYSGLRGKGRHELCSSALVGRRKPFARQLCLQLFTCTLSHLAEVDNQGSSCLVFTVGSGVRLDLAHEVFKQSIISASLCLNHSSIFSPMERPPRICFLFYQLLCSVKKRVPEHGSRFHDEVIILILFKVVAFAVPLFPVLLALCLSFL